MNEAGRIGVDIRGRRLSETDGEQSEANVGLPATRRVRGVERRMRLRYGLNEADSWWHFAVGPQRERIWAKLREMRPRIIRIFLYDKNAPDPVKEWELFSAYVQAVLNVGAVPMLTFSKLHRPPDDPRAVRWFTNQCADVAWNCLERWGEERVGEW